VACTATITTTTNHHHHHHHRHRYTARATLTRTACLPVHACPATALPLLPPRPPPDYHPDKHERMQAVFRYYLHKDQSALAAFPGGSEPGT
jgi:hypothetical protein